MAAQQQRRVRAIEAVTCDDSLGTAVGDWMQLDLDLVHAVGEPPTVERLGLSAALPAVRRQCRGTEGRREGRLDPRARGAEERPRESVLGGHDVARADMAQHRRAPAALAPRMPGKPFAVDRTREEG